MRFWAMLACMAAAMLAIQPAHAETHVELLGTWPAGDMVTLHRNQNFYMHFGYRSDQPVQIWVQPYFEGKQVNAGSNPSRTHPAGSGEALGWFFLSDPGTQVDEVKVTAATARTTAHRWSQRSPSRSLVTMRPPKAQRSPHGWRR